MIVTIKPTKTQHEAWEALRKYQEVFFGGGAGGGKSWWLCETRLSNCYMYPGYKSFIAREELKRLMESTYITWCKVCAYHNIPKSDWKLNGQYNYIEFKNGSRIDLLDAKYLPSDPLYERFGSLEYSDGAIEEAGEIHYMAYEVLKTRIGRHLNKELGINPTMAITGNPKKNWTYTTFYLPNKNQTLPEYIKFIQSLYYDNPHIAKEYGKRLMNIKDKATKERLMKGNWDYDDDPTAMIGFEHIDALWLNNHVQSGRKHIIGDIARFGSDKAIITIWDGFKLIEYHKFDISALTDIQNCIQAMRTKYGIPVFDTIVDEDGMGGGVVDNCHIKGFVNNSKAFNSNYQNLKTECGYKLAETMNEDKIYIECEMPEHEKQIIREELGQLKTYDSDKDNKLRILPKEKVKENIGRSPDWLDVFIMRMYYEVRILKDTNIWA